MDNIENISIFSALDDAYLQALKKEVHTKHYTKDSIVFYEGDRGDYLHILIEGRVKLYKTSPKGTQIYINRISAPALVAEYVCFEREPFPATCEFVTDGTMGLLHFEHIYKCLGQPAFSLELVKSLTSKVLLLSSLVHQETILSSEAKIADLMIHKPSIFSRLKNNEIASILNLTPETFSRILTKMKKEGIIKIEHHQLLVLNKDALYAIIDNNTIKTCTNCIADFKEKIGYKE